MTGRALTLEEATARVAQLEAELAQAKAVRDEIVVSEFARTSNVLALAQRAGLSRKWVYQLADGAGVKRAPGERRA